MTSISENQLQALRWVQRYSTIPPVEPRTWKSLVTRGWVKPVGGYIALTITESGNKVLEKH